jgi:hypothetical protein
MGRCQGGGGWGHGAVEWRGAVKEHGKNGVAEAAVRSGVLCRHFARLAGWGVAQESAHWPDQSGHTVVSW